MAYTKTTWATGDVVTETKMNNIETGVEDAHDASQVLALIKTVDGAGSGLDADLLDGNSSAHYLNASNINAGTLDLARLPTIDDSVLGTGTDERDWVLARCSEAGAGAVGTYALLEEQSTSSDPGTNRAGSNLRFTNSNGLAGPIPSGTWKCMGDTDSSNQPTVWLRVS